MENLSIEKFNPKKADLLALVAECSKIDGSDLVVVKETRIKLKKARVDITKQGKAMRDDAIKFQKEVIAREKELVAIIEPEEERLSEIEEIAKQKKLREERLAVLPVRKEELGSIGDGVEVSDDELLDMDAAQFTTYKNERVAAKLEADRVALEEAQAKVREEEERQQREKEVREREEQARKEEQELAERRLQEEKERAELRIQQEKEEAERRVIAERERIEREAKEKAEQEKREQEEADRAQKAEQEALEKKKKYQKFLADNNFDEKTDHIVTKEGEVKIYRLVAKMKI